MIKMIELTITDARAIKDDLWYMESLKQDIQIMQREKRNERWIDDTKKDIDRLEKKIRARLPSCSLDDLDEAICHAINKDASMKARHITVDDLPKVPRSTRLPKKINPVTFAKRAARFINRSHHDDCITHIESGRAWDVTTGATPEEFLEVMK